ncbi:MAG: DUF6448 family protein [Phycisphaerales bacterium JB039]
MNFARTAMAAAAMTAIATVWLVADTSLAHCDTMDGPIIPEALRALDSGDVRPLLKWIPEQEEGAIREAFDRARAVRDMGSDVQAMADQFFLETLIRIHRAGEGEPFTGIKPAGSAPPVFKAADDALASGSVDALADQVAQSVRDEIKRRFEAASLLRAGMDDSPEAGRAYVRQYVRYLHLVEAIDGLLGEDHSGAPGHVEGRPAHGREHR